MSEKPIPFGDLQQKDLFCYPNHTGDVYQKTQSECPHCGHVGSADLFYSCQPAQKMVGGIENDVLVAPVTDLTPWTLPFAALIHGRRFRLLNDGELWVKEALDVPDRPCDRCTTGDINARKYAATRERHFCPDTRVLDMRRMI